MKDKVNVLIFPAGAENAIEIFESLKYNLHFKIYGATSSKDYAEYLYPSDRLIIKRLHIADDTFISEMNYILEAWEIDYLIPSHDEIACYLAKHQDKLKACIITSPYETARIAMNKKLIYEALEEYDFVPKIYKQPQDIEKYPVFLKPYIGAGGKGTFVVDEEDTLYHILSKNDQLLISEFLPGKEYTVDCFTNKKGELLFCGARIRERITMGITFHAERVIEDEEFRKIAHTLNRQFKFRGAWFFQVKEDKNGKIKLMEFSVRQAGTMAFYRQLGINFAALSLFDAMGYDLKIIFNNYKISLDRRLSNRYKLEYNYDKVYIDFDDTLIIRDKVNTLLMQFIYQCCNYNKKIYLITKHSKNLENTLRMHKINKELFEEIILLNENDKKCDYVDRSNSIFIDNYFPERLHVKDVCKIPVFDVDAVDCLIDEEYY